MIVNFGFHSDKILKYEQKSIDHRPWPGTIIVRLRQFQIDSLEN
jgi:hypothetical protein